MLAKRIIAVLTFDNGSLTRTKNFIQDYKYTNLEALLLVCWDPLWRHSMILNSN